MKQAQTILIALPVLAATALVPVQAQTLYSTEDYRQDSPPIIGTILFAKPET